MNADRATQPLELKSELARWSLTGASEDFNLKLAWINSICALVLGVGVLGYRRGVASTRPIAPMQETVAAIVEPLPPPPPSAEQPQTQENEPEKLDAPQVVIVTPDAPSINFSVPTIGNLVAPTATAIATAPPLHPLAPVTPLRSRPMNLQNTGGSGERPQPPYPKLAMQQGQQGKVTLLISADDQGSIASVEIKESSGSPILDRSAVDHVRRHWILPRGTGTRLFETSIIYRLERN